VVTPNRPDLRASGPQGLRQKARSFAFGAQYSPAARGQPAKHPSAALAWPGRGATFWSSVWRADRRRGPLPRQLPGEPGDAGAPAGRARTHFEPPSPCPKPLAFASILHRRRVFGKSSLLKILGPAAQSLVDIQTDGGAGGRVTVLIAVNRDPVCTSDGRGEVDNLVWIVPAARADHPGEGIRTRGDH
jgi:hypothetical protein